MGNNKKKKIHKEENDDDDKSAEVIQKKRRPNSSTTNPLPLEREEPVYKINQYGKAEPLQRDNISIETLLNPLTKDNFMLHVFRQKALHISSKSDTPNEYNNIWGKERTNDLRKGMFDLDLQQMLEQTSSDNIFVWLTKKNNEDGNNIAKKNKHSDRHNQVVESIQVDDAGMAHKLHSLGDHSLYFRAPPQIEQPLVSSMLASTGMGCGQYDPSGTSSITMGHGEVETFVGTRGHFTNWHTDFQENFTIQLSGIKRWKLKQGTVKHPLRGCTPHYGKVEAAIESQLKMSRLSSSSTSDKLFEFDHPNETNSYGNISEIIMNSGDVLYFPAGMWHCVETIEPGISINISLMATNYADLVTKSLHHYLLSKDHWREAITLRSTNGNNLVPVLDKLRVLIQELPSITKIFADNNYEECILPPAIRDAPTFYLDEHSDDKSDSNSLNDDESDHIQTVDSCDEAMIEVNSEENDSLLSQEIDDKDDEEVSIIRVETGSFHRPNHERRKNMNNKDQESEVILQRNPLASLIPLSDITSFYENKNKSNQTCSNNNEYILNVNFGGNDNFESYIRVILIDTSPNNLLRKISSKPKSFQKIATVKEKFGLTTEESFCTLECLVYYGLFFWRHK